MENPSYYSETKTLVGKNPALTLDPLHLLLQSLFDELFLRFILSDGYGYVSDVLVLVVFIVTDLNHVGRCKN